ncbi:MAG: TonB-dependent receptor [Gemmatimonadota bacterium]
MTTIAHRVLNPALRRRIVSNHPLSIRSKENTMDTVVRRISRLALALLALSLLPAAAAAQQGSLAGTVRSTEGEPLSGVQVTLTGTGLGTLSGEDGSFRVTGIPAGTYSVEATSLGYAAWAEPGVRIEADETTRIEITLSDQPVALGGFVVSASRGVERVTDAPATIARIDERELDMSVGNNFAGALKEVQGLDYIQVGSTAAAINARGFNSSFNNRMLMIEDNRISVLPESGLPIGGFTAIPKVDLAGIEVLVGPGAALYGADASNGVISLQTKDPFQYQGTDIEIAGGNRSYFDAQFRHAQTFGNFGFKVAGEYQEVDDWANELTYTSGGVEFPEIGIDFKSQVKRVSGAVVNYAGKNRFELSGGWSESDGVGQTNVGRNQFDDWTYNFAQFEFSNPNFYVNLYRNQSQAGNSYAVNRYSVNRVLMPDLTDEEVKLESDWPSDGRLYGAEAQGRFGLDFLDTDVVLGAQYRRDQVSSDREWLTDRFTGEDVTINTYGFYGQIRSSLLDKLDLVLAARLDEHDNYDTQFSPKAGLVFSPTEDQSVRVTWNRAFKSPTILQTNFWIPNFVPAVGVFGNTTGFIIDDGAGTVLQEIAAIEPETNTTWEVGYKGVLGDRVYLDATLFRSDYENFFSPLTTIANPFGGSFASFADSGEPVTDEDGNPQILLTYFNLGQAVLQGLDLGANVVLTDRFTLSATTSLYDLESVDAPENAQGEEATALNSPTVKWTLGLNAVDLGPVTAGMTLRHVTGYEFRSGINAGKIPTFETVDVMMSTALWSTGADLNIGVSNLFTCRSANPATGDEERACGFGEEHIEMVNMPSIGTNFFLGVRYRFR